MINPTETTGDIIARLERENAALLTRCKKAEQEHQYALTEIDRQSFMVQSLQAENAALREQVKDYETSRAELDALAKNWYREYREQVEKNTALRAMLKKLEWSRNIVGRYGLDEYVGCPICSSFIEGQHKPDCELDLLLKGAADENA